MAHTLSCDAAADLFSMSRAFAVLNLAHDGRPLTFARAKAGPDSSNWFAAEGEEIRRLIGSETMRGITQSEQTADRRADITY